MGHVLCMKGRCEWHASGASVARFARRCSAGQSERGERASAKRASEIGSEIARMLARLAAASVVVSDLLFTVLWAASSAASRAFRPLIVPPARWDRGDASEIRRDRAPVEKQFTIAASEERARAEPRGRRGEASRACERRSAAGRDGKAREMLSATVRGGHT